MLTKDLIKFKLRKNKIYPEFLDPRNLSTVALIGDLLATREAIIGKKIADIESIWSELAVASEPFYAGIKKLLLDAMVWLEPDETHQAERQALLLDAQAVRTETLFESVEAFQEALANSQVSTFSNLQSWLYSDLPENRCLLQFPDYTAATLVHRYNSALVQGLLLRSNSIFLELGLTKIEERRPLFRSLKFHQLIAETNDAAGESKALLSFKIEGPLKLFDNALVYGQRLSRFFPRILNLSQWKMSASIDLSPKKKGLTLELDNSCGLQSHYRQQLSYVPEEIDLFMQRFNQTSTSWKVETGLEFVHLGRQSYCFPDLKFVMEGEEPVFMEVFHRWHRGQLLGRMDALKHFEARNVLLAVHKNLLADPELNKNLNNSEWFSRYGVKFRDYPSSKSVLTVLSRGQTL